mgnify:CR=1 FL=1
MKRVAFFLEGINQRVIPFTLEKPDEIFLKGSLEACINAMAKKYKLTIQNVEPLNQSDSYRVYFTKKEGSIFSRKNRTYIYYVKVL